jgi:hypothetical protein
MGGRFSAGSGSVCGFRQQRSTRCPYSPRGSRPADYRDDETSIVARGLATRDGNCSRFNYDPGRPQHGQPRGCHVWRGETDYSLRLATTMGS